jgi:hypothetical protein
VNHDGSMGGSELDAALRMRLESLIEEGSDIWESFDREVRQQHWHPFVAADYGRVLQDLLALRAPGLRFLEWGSATGVITIMADLLGFDAYGIELDALGDDAAQDRLDDLRVLAQARLRGSREDGPQVGAGGEMEDACELGLLADVRAELFHRVVDAVQRAFQGVRVLLRLVRDEAEQESFLVVEVVVDGGAPHARGAGDVGERDGVEAALRHEGRERCEQLLPRHLAVFVQALADDLGHDDIIGAPRQLQVPGKGPDGRRGDAIGGRDPT